MSTRVTIFSGAWKASLCLRWKMLLVVVALLLAAGGFAWYWQATAVDRQVEGLLAEVRSEVPTGMERWLIKLRLMLYPGTLYRCSY